MKKYLLALAFGVAALCISACDANDGPIEEAAEEVEESIKDVGDNMSDAAEDVADDVEDAVDNPEN